MLGDEPRPGIPRKITDADVERVIVKTLEEKPKNATHWSTRSMAAATGMSQWTVSWIWRRSPWPRTGRTRLLPVPQAADALARSPGWERELMLFDWRLMPEPGAAGSWGAGRSDRPAP
ncbi:MULTISPECIES: hypothetical protein [Streptomyces]|uniref:hypothetical protein n=1 Tax=Streptomyces TaxID=1883 RepID=UPI00324980C1